MWESQQVWPRISASSHFTFGFYSFSNPGDLGDPHQVLARDLWFFSPRNMRSSCIIQFSTQQQASNSAFARIRESHTQSWPEFSALFSCSRLAIPLRSPGDRVGYALATGRISQFFSAADCAFACRHAFISMDQWIDY